MPTAVVAGPESEELALTRLRQAIGRRMTESKTTVPHFYVTTEVDMGAALALRKPVSYTHLRAHETVLDTVCRLLLETKQPIHTPCYTMTHFM